MPDAEDEESKTGRGNLTEGRGKVEDREPLPGPKVRNQDHRAGAISQEAEDGGATA